MKHAGIWGDRNAVPTHFPQSFLSFPHHFQHLVENWMWRKITAVCADSSGQADPTAKSAVETDVKTLSTACGIPNSDKRRFPRISPQSFPFHSTISPLLHMPDRIPLFPKLPTPGMWKNNHAVSDEFSCPDFFTPLNTTTSFLFVCFV